MKHTYLLGHRWMACGLLISLLLQGCFNLDSSITSRGNAPVPADIQENAASHWDAPTIARDLWKKPGAIIDPAIVNNVNLASKYLATQGYQLKGAKADGDCFFSAFLGSYHALSVNIPLLDRENDKISYLRSAVASYYKDKPHRKGEIQQKGAWVHSDEGGKLAKFFKIPIRLVTVNQGQTNAEANDMLIFPESDRANQEWKTIPANERPTRCILMVDVGGHFLWTRATQPLVESQPQANGGGRSYQSRKRSYENEGPNASKNATPSTQHTNFLDQLEEPFEIKGTYGTYKVYPKIDIRLRDQVFNHTGLWLRFPEGQTEINVVVGKGYFGGMYLAQSEDTREFLGIKIIAGEMSIRQSAQEGRLQMQLNGKKHLMPLKDSFTTKLQGKKVLCHVMPLAGLGSVKAISKALQQKELPIRVALAYHIAKGVMTGLQQMHDLHLYHLDLRDANVVVDKEGKVWVIDFGCMQASDQKGYFVRNCKGYLSCLSPQRRNRGASGKFSGAAADSWAVGIVLLQLLAGELDGRYLEDPMPLLNQWQQDHTLPEAWIQFLKGLLAPVETERLNMAQALAQLAQLEPENLDHAIQQLPALVHNLQTGEGEQVPSLLIRPKKKPKLGPIPTLSPNELQSLQARYQKGLKQRYLQHSTLKTIFGNPLTLENSYINLAIVQTEERKDKKDPAQEGKEKNKLNLFQDERLSSFEDLFGEKHQVSIEQLFDQQKGHKGADRKNRHRFALVQGRAGIGKTTFSRYISYLWAKDKLWKEDYDWVFRITLRELTQNPAFHQKTNYTLEELVYHTCFPQEEWPVFAAFWRQYLSLQAPEKLLFDLDGYDEIATITSNPKHPLYQPLHDLLHQNRYIVLLTTRPYGISDLPPRRQNLEIMGFNHDNIEAYVKHYFTGLYVQAEEASTHSQNLLAFLKQHPSVWSNAHIPINLNLLCGIHEKLYDQASFSMSELYLQLEETLLQRAWELEHAQKLTGRSKIKRELLYQDFAKERSFLQRLAFQAMRQESLIINADLLEDVLKQVVPQQAHVKSMEDAKDAFIRHIHQIGLLKPTTTASAYAQENERDKPHEFMHLTFQEYFAAHYVAEGLVSTNPSYCSEIIHFIRTEKFNPQYQIIFWFVAGILKARGEKLEEYLNLLQERASRDLLEDYQMGLLARCYEEGYAANQTALQTTFTDLQMYLEMQLQLVKLQNLTSMDDFVKSYFVTMLSMSPQLHQQLIDWITVNIFHYLKMKNYKGNLGRKRTWHFIRLNKSRQPTLLKALVGALKDETQYKDVRSNAAEALSYLGEQMENGEVVIQALVQALEDEDKDICNNAMRALGGLGKQVTINEKGVQILVQALDDQDEEVRKNAAKTLGDLGEKVTASEKTIQALIQALDDKDEEVHENVVEALGALGEQAAANEQVIQALVQTLLMDENILAKSNAMLSLSNLGQNTVATEKIIQALVQNLGNKDEEVHANIVCAFVNMCHTTRRAPIYGTDKVIIHEKVIQALVQALADKNKYVRDHAMDALVDLADLADLEFNEKAIQALMQALKDEYWLVRFRATQVLDKLGKLGEKLTANKEVTQALIQALSDEAIPVRNHAVIALGNLIRKTAINEEVIQVLVQILLTDESATTRSNAAEALSKLGKKVATIKKVVQALRQALTDEDEWVCIKAACALSSLGEKVAIDERMVQDMIQALVEEDWLIRNDAVKALGELGGEMAPNEKVIQALIQALADEEFEVQGNAVQALCKLGEKTATIQVINALLEALKDQASDVCRNAAKALEKMGSQIEIMLKTVFATWSWEIGKHVNLVMALAYCCMKAKAAMQIQARQQNYSLVVFANKTRYVHPNPNHPDPISANQAQVLLRVLPIAVSMFMGLEPFDINRCQEIVQQLPPVNDDPLLQELSTTSETPIRESWHNVHCNDLPGSTPAEDKPLGQLPPSPIASSLAPHVPVSPIEALKSTLRAIAKHGTLSTKLEENVMRVSLSANSNPVNAKPLLRDLYQNLKELPELWKFVKKCKFEGEQLVIATDMEVDAEELQEKLDAVWQEVDRHRKRPYTFIEDSNGVQDQR